MKIDKGRLLVLFLIFSETFFFIALIIAYVYYRNFSDATDTVAKNLDAVNFLYNTSYHWFWHEQDMLTITSKGKL